MFNERYCFLLILVIMPYFQLFAQEMNFFQPFDVVSTDIDFRIVAVKNSNTYLIKRYTDKFPEIIVVNHQGAVIVQRPVPIPLLNNGSTFEAIVNGGRMTLVYQYAQEGYVYVNAAIIHNNGELDSNIKLDSSRIDQLNEAAWYDYKKHPAESRIILYRHIAGVEKSKLLSGILEIDADGKLLNRLNCAIPFEAGAQTVSPLFLHTNDKLYLAVFDKYQPGKDSMDLLIYTYHANVKQCRVTAVKYRGVQLLNPRFVAGSSPAELVIVSLYVQSDQLVLGGMVTSHISLESSKSQPLSTYTFFGKKRPENADGHLSPVSILYQPQKGDDITILHAGMAIDKKTVRVLLERRRSVVNDDPAFQQLQNIPPNGSAVPGLANTTPSQQLDILRTVVKNTGTPVNRISGSSASINLYGLGTAPVSSGALLPNTAFDEPSVPFIEILSDYYQPNSNAHSFGILGNASGINPGLLQERIFLQVDRKGRALIKEELSSNHPGRLLPVMSSLFSDKSGIVIFNHYLNSTQDIALQIFTGNGEPLKTMVWNNKKAIPFHRNNLIFTDNHTAFTLYTGAEGGTIGLAKINWQF